MNRKAAILVVCVFALGLALGGVATHIAEKRVFGSPAQQVKWVERVVLKLTDELNLTPAQQQQVSAILEDTKKRYDGIYEPIRPQMELARHDGRARIRGVLTPEQLPKFEEYLKQLDERRKREAGR